MNINIKTYPHIMEVSKSKARVLSDDLDWDNSIAPLPAKDFQFRLQVARHRMFWKAAPALPQTC